MKNNIIFALILILLFSMIGCVNPQQDNEQVGTLLHDHEMLTIPQAQALFKENFTPKFPTGYSWNEYSFEREYYPNHQQKPSTLLSTKNNYYLTINNPEKYYKTEKKIYEAYSLIVATESLYHSPVAYGITQDEIDALSPSLIWLEGEKEYLNYFDITGYVGNQENSNLSYVEYNAFSDNIMKNYTQHRYPRVEKSIADNGKNLKVENLDVKYHIYQYGSYDEISIDTKKYCLVAYKLYVHFKIGNVNYAIITPIGKTAWEEEILLYAKVKDAEDSEQKERFEEYVSYTQQLDNVAQKMTIALTKKLITDQN